MTGRPGLDIGENGDVWVRSNGRGGFQARTRVRDQDGRIRDIRATGDTRGAARRALQRRLADRTPPTAVGVTASTTVSQLGDYWLEQRSKTALLDARPTIKPQTLAAYNDTLRLVIVPALGNIRIREVRVGLLDNLLADLDATGVSTAQARSVLRQMLAVAVRHGALAVNPMTQVHPLGRREREIEVLTLPQVAALRALVLPQMQRRPGYRGPNGDLRAVVDGLLGTGCRISELLALTWTHVDLDGAPPTARICGTLVEPRGSYVRQMHRQESTKSNTVRTLILPSVVRDQLTARKSASGFDGPTDPVYASRTGRFLWPANIRTRLRSAVGSDPDLAGTTPHTLRRTVGTLIAHRHSLDAAREQLGHSDPGTTFQYYVAPRALAPDLREIFDLLLPSESA